MLLMLIIGRPQDGRLPCLPLMLLTKPTPLRLTWMLNLLLVKAYFIGIFGHRVTRQGLPPRVQHLVLSLLLYSLWTLWLGIHPRRTLNQALMSLCTRLPLCPLLRW